MAEKHKLQIHCTKVFAPKPLGITHLALSGDEQSVAVVRKFFYKNDQENLKIRFVEVYRMLSKLVLVHSFVEYEQISGVGWLSEALLVTVSLAQNISVHSLKTGQKIFTTITDYGPITSMRLSLEHNLLLTGTQYGYVAAYQIVDKGKSIKPINKMVKINGSINYLDLHMKSKEADKTSASSGSIPNRPKKRKRAPDSGGESGSDDEHHNDSEFLENYEILIFGASGGDVVAWDYHKKTIIDTVHIGEDIKVNVLLALDSGEVVVGDSAGTVSVLDTNTFTCRYRNNVMSSEVLCLTKSFNESSLIVSGQHSAIIIMKRDKSDRDEYRLKEKIEAQTNRITSISCMSKNRFLSGSMEGFLTVYKRGKDNCLDRYTLGPNYSSQISCFNGEMLIRYNRSLVIWGLLKTDRENSDPAELTNLEPTKVMTFRAKHHVQSCTFNDIYLAYSGPHGLYVFHRGANKKPIMLHKDGTLSKCSCLKICGNYLIACSYNRLTVIQLDENHENVGACKILASHNLKSIVQQMVYMEALGQLIIACGPIKNLIYRLDLNSKSVQPFSIVGKINFSEDKILTMISGPSDKYVYIYTDTDKILKVNVANTVLNESKIQKRLAGKSRIQGLPKDAHTFGMIMLTKDHGILYDSKCMYKIDFNSNEVVNHNPNYNQIVTMDNQAFGDPQDLALVELTLNDYRAELPSIAPPKKR